MYQHLSKTLLLSTSTKQQTRITHPHGITITSRLSAWPQQIITQHTPPRLKAKHHVHISPISASRPYSRLPLPHRAQSADSGLYQQVPRSTRCPQVDVMAIQHHHSSYEFIAPQHSLRQMRHYLQHLPATGCLLGGSLDSSNHGARGLLLLQRLGPLYF